MLAGESRQLLVQVRAPAVRSDYILSVTADADNDAFELNNEYRAGASVISSIETHYAGRARAPSLLATS